MLEQLKQLQKLFSKDDSWIQKYFSHLKPNLPPLVVDKVCEKSYGTEDAPPEYFCFCLMGGVRRVIGLQDFKLYEDMHVALFKQIQILDPSYLMMPEEELGALGSGVIAFNDAPSTSLEDVRKVIAMAIKLEEARILAS